MFRYKSLLNVMKNKIVISDLLTRTKDFFEFYYFMSGCQDHFALLTQV